MIKIMLLTILFSCTQMDNQFLKKVLNDFDNNSYFIAIDVVSELYNGRVVIQNNDLFYYLEQNEGLDKEMYKDTMIKIFQNNSLLNIKSADLEKWDFVKVQSIPLLTESAKKGADEFIKIYFDDKVLKDGISDVERAAIINQLFEWEIASYIDDETGYLVISR